MWRIFRNLVVALSFVVTTGCFGEQCECEDGQYQAIYQRLDGTCGMTEFYNIPIVYQYSQIAKWEKETINFSYTQKTHLSYHGCAMNLTHEVRNEETLIFHIDGEVGIDNETRLSGRVFRIDFDKSTTLETCRGNYNVTLTKMGELEGY